MNIKSKSEGFTLIEMLLYIGIIAIMLATLLSFSLQMLASSAKSQTDQTVYSEERYATERLTYEIRNAAGVNVASSSFGVNLAASSTAMLSLSEASSPLNPTVFSVASGTFMVQQGTGAPIALNSSSTQVTSLVFSNYSTGTYNNVGFLMNISDSSTSTRNEYVASTTIEGSAEVRSK